MAWAIGIVPPPQATAVAAFKAALKRGDIFIHAFPHDGEASYFPDASLFESALTMAKRVAEDVGIAAPISVRNQLF